MSNFFIEKRQVTIVKLLKTRWANKLKNLLNQESIIFTSCNGSPQQIPFQSANGFHPIRRLHKTFFEKFLFKFPLSHKEIQIGQMMYSYQFYKL